jgi:glycosyltransferase A (GT-A) superfamily protein (DUF2064 family)
MDAPVLVMMLDYPEGEWLPARLRAQLGDTFTARMVRLLTELQLAQMPQNWPIEIHVAPGEQVGAVRHWIGEKPVAILGQLSAPWDERLAQAAAEATARHDGPVIILRTDCPYCSVDTIIAAAKALLDHEVVLGPATDGDFYLLGLRQWPSGLLHDINWGTNQVLFGLTRRCSDLGLRYALLDPLERVRDEASWERAIARLTPRKHS